MANEKQLREALQTIAKRAEQLSFEPWDHGENFLFEELQKMAEDALAAEPAPLVRLTDEEIEKCYLCHMRDRLVIDYKVFSNAIMDALEAKNGGKG